MRQLTLRDHPDINLGLTAKGVSRFFQLSFVHDCQDVADLCPCRARDALLASLAKTSASTHGSSGTSSCAQ